MTPADVEKILAIAPKYGIGIVLPDRLPVPTVAAGVADYAARDAAGRVAFYVLLWKRKGITLDGFDDYWRDVHGPVCARLPGQFQYWQFHVAHNEGGAFPAVEGASYATAEADQFDGIAELTFRSVADRQTWFDAAGILMDDEHNIFSKAIGYVTEQSNSQTYLDGIATGDPNGDGSHIKFHVLVRQAPGVSTTEFRRYMTDSLAANVARSDKVLKFRLHLFEPPDMSRPDAAGVAHYEPPEKQYQAAYEIAFRNHLDMELFFASADYAAAVREQARYVVQVSALPGAQCLYLCVRQSHDIGGATRLADGRADHGSGRHQSTAGQHPRPGRWDDRSQRTDRRQCDQETHSRPCEWETGSGHHCHRKNYQSE